MEPIRIKKKELKDWMPLDFVFFFRDKYATTYNESLKLEFAKDCMNMKRMIIKFRKNDRAKNVLKNFIEWGFVEYEKQRKVKHDLRGNLTIGFLTKMLDEYLGIDSSQPKKKRKQKVELSDETKKWLAEQKKSYKETKDERTG